MQHVYIHYCIMFMYTYVSYVSYVYIDIYVQMYNV